MKCKCWKLGTNFLVFRVGGGGSDFIIIGSLMCDVGIENGRKEYKQVDHLFFALIEISMFVIPIVAYICRAKVWGGMCFLW